MHILYYNYIQALKGTLERQQHLREGKYFDCSCQRCEDISELGTDISSIICPRCYQGIVRSNKIKWKCTNCSRDFSASLMRTTTLIAKSYLDDLGEYSLDKIKII